MPYSFQIRSGGDIINIVQPSAPEATYDWLVRFDPTTDVTEETISLSSFAVVSALQSAWYFATESALGSSSQVDLSSQVIIEIQTSTNSDWFFITASALGSAGTFSVTGSASITISGLNSAWHTWSYS